MVGYVAYCISVSSINLYMKAQGTVSGPTPSVHIHNLHLQILSACRIDAGRDAADSVFYGVRAQPQSVPVRTRR